MGVPGRTKIEQLKGKTRELTDRAQLLSQAIGTYYGITNAWEDGTLDRCSAPYFNLSRYFALQIIILQSCALLQTTSRKDDAVLWEFYNFLRNGDCLNELIETHNHDNPDLGSYYMGLARNNAMYFTQEMDSIDTNELEDYYTFRSKRIAHSTMTAIVSPPRIKAAIAFARKAIRCSDLAYVLFAQTGFDHKGSEEMAFDAASAAVRPHLVPRRRRKMEMKP